MRAEGRRAQGHFTEGKAKLKEKHLTPFFFSSREAVHKSTTVG